MTAQIYGLFRNSSFFPPVSFDLLLLLCACSSDLHHGVLSLFVSVPIQCTVQVKLELGHRAQLRKKVTSEGFTHDWMVFVRGPETGDIQHFVEKVVFRLHDSFPKPKRGEKRERHASAQAQKVLLFKSQEAYFYFVKEKCKTQSSK